MEHMSARRMCTLFFGISLVLSTCLACQEAQPEEAAHPRSARSGMHKLTQYIKTNKTTKIQDILSEHPELIHENLMGQPVLHLVVLFNETEAVTEILRMLITAGCNVNCLNHEKKTALHYATMYKKEAVAQCLEELGGQIITGESQENTAAASPTSYWSSRLLQFIPKPC